jgi:hypothetical protein
MSNPLDALVQPAARPVRMTILGEAGTGKTTLACTAFPNPVVLRFEDGMQSLGDNAPMATPVYRTMDEASAFVKALAEQAGEHEYKTLIVDSITHMCNSVIEPEVLKSDPRGAKNLAQAHGGYGAGYAQACELTRQFVTLCTAACDHANMHLVFIGHAASEVVEWPDSDPYQRLTLRCNKRYTQFFVDDVDVVALLKLKSNTYGSGERKKLKTDGTRILHMSPSPASVTKNRYGITEDIEIVQGENPFTFIPSLNNQEQFA